MNRVAPKPRSGRYVDNHGRKCWVLVSREATPFEDGSVIVDYDDGHWTSAFFHTFELWGFQRLPDEEQ